MFERKKKQIEVPTVETRTITVPTAEGIKDMIVPAVASAAAVAKEYASEAAHQASDYLEQGREMAKPHLEQGRALAETKAAQAKERVTDNAKLAEFLASGAAAREIATQRSRDAALVLKGEATATPIKKKGGFAKLVVNLGILTVLGAVAAVVVQKLQGPKDDPWARPLTDPYVAPPAGRDSTTAGGTGVQVSEVGDQAADTEIQPAAGQVPTESSSFTPPVGTTTLSTDGSVDSEPRKDV